MEQNPFFSEIVVGKYVNKRKLRSRCYEGIPDEHRVVAYKLLLGVYETDTTLFQEIDENNLNLYKMSLASNTDYYSEEYFTSQNGLYVSYQISTSVIHQIFIDIRRIDLKHRIINGVDLSYVYMNVLVMTAARRPYLEYVQGMCDLVVPFLVLIFDDNSNSMQKESDVFACFDKLLDRIQHNIISMQETPIEQTKNKLRRTDRKLYRHFKRIDLNLHFITFRWFNCLFVREFDLRTLLRLFDSMLSADTDIFLVNFAVTLLISCRNSLLEKDFSEAVSYIQNIGKSDIGVLEILRNSVLLDIDQNM
ncbi:GYP1 [Enterospora canceri]|uniref:GYP1 n=1 Tax=Enterospora canceri TaxID=1081671 RepID=A0A1Y1S6K4_9MICR|nr:GYP1 [Enterospora canceri]